MIGARFTLTDRKILATESEKSIFLKKTEISSIEEQLQTLLDKVWASFAHGFQLCSLSLIYTHSRTQLEFSGFPMFRVVRISSLLIAKAITVLSDRYRRDAFPGCWKRGHRLKW